MLLSSVAQDGVVVVATVCGRAGGVDGGLADEDGGIPSSALSLPSVSALTHLFFSIFYFVLLLPSSSFYFCSFLPLVDPLSLWSQKQTPPLCFIFFVLPLCCLLFLSFVSQTNLPPQKQYVPPLNLSFASLFSKKIDHLFV
jgi:hypothetical protein